ncbi:MAG: 4-hydroxy-tetrahydrodipicolinate synthase [Leptospiraceae bacterium]|nr:4-hydroxy-tetrahydrodipicolinate synthase [Leptospiraceae bacterium]MCB1303093.1 4-hydroxy-tetrahydrodipicolinate synthase [Leptospiraceae bacterium]
MQFQGLYTAILTPFNKGGQSIDYGAYKALLEKQVEAGLSGVVPCGTTGESPTLSHQEHRELIQKTVELINGRIAVIPGTGSNSTREAIELTRDACSMGVDGVMLVNPYYNKPSQEGLYQHFKSIAEQSTKPVVLYNIKGRTAINVEPETILRLTDVPMIQVIKEASGDPGQMARIMRLCGDRIVMLSGDDNITPAVMGLGGKGVISVASNLYPKKLNRMVGHFLQGNFAAGNQVFYELLDMMNAMFWETNPVPVKAAAEMLGLCNGELRLPLVSLGSEKKELLKRVLDQLGEDQ